MKKLAVSALLLLQTSFVFAGGSQGLVTKPLANRTGLFMFSAGVHNNKPACVTTDLGTWAVDAGTDGGKAIQAIVLTAYAQGKTLKVIGTGNCTVKTDREDISYVHVVE